MKSSSYVHFRLGLALVLTLSSAATGCRSSSWKMPSWKMPGSRFFSSREPDPATLAGRNGVPQLPESPATKYTASNIASVGKSPAAMDPNKGTNSSLANNGSYGYAAPSTTPTATAANGLAAQGNGYQVGSYPVGSSGSSSATAGTLAAVSPNGLPSPYGGTYSGAPTARTGTTQNANGNSAVVGIPSDLPLPTSVANSLTAGPSTTNSMLPSATFPQGLPDTTSASYAATINPSPGMMPDTGLPPLPTSLPSLPPTSGTAGFLDPSRTAAASSFTLGGTNTPTPPSTAYQGNTTVGFAPGTTGRSTTYNFSGNASGSGVTGGNSLVPPNTSLPPNTATLPNTLPPRF